MERGNALTLVGWLFCGIGVLAIFNSLLHMRWSGVLWLCYICLILLGLGTLRRDSGIVATQLYILGLPLVIWTFDFITALVMPQSLLGITDYFFRPGETLAKAITLQHLFTVPLALYVLSQLGLKQNRAFRFSLIQIAAVFIITRLVTGAADNINCVYRSCTTLIPTEPGYTFVWFGVLFSLMIITATIVSRLPFIEKK